MDLESAKNAFLAPAEQLHEELCMKMQKMQEENIRLELIDSHENSHRYDSIK